MPERRDIRPVQDRKTRQVLSELSAEKHRLPEYDWMFERFNTLSTNLKSLSDNEQQEWRQYIHQIIMTFGLGSQEVFDTWKEYNEPDEDDQIPSIVHGSEFGSVLETIRPLEH